MQPSPLEILFYYVEALRWKLEPEHNPDTPVPLQPADLKWHLQRDDDADEGPRQTAYRLTVSLASGEGRFPYSFEIVVVGYFRLHESVSEEHLAQVLDSNAPALLYGSAREALATSLGRGPFRPLVLPSVHFLGLQREPEVESSEEKAVEAPSSAAASKRASQRNKGTATKKVD